MRRCACRTACSIGCSQTRRAAAIVVCATVRGIWVAAERLPEILRGASAGGDRRRCRAARRRAPRAPGRAKTAIVELVRGRLTIVGPTTAADARATRARSARPMRTPRCLALESEGAGAARVVHARRVPAPIEWCDRRLLARIHRYTLNRLARGDRAGQPGRLHALPLRLAARRAVEPADRPRRTARDRRRRSTDSSSPPAAGNARSCRRAWIATTARCSTCLCLTGEVGWARLSKPLRPAEPAGTAGRHDADRAVSARTRASSGWRCAERGRRPRRTRRSSNAPRAACTMRSSGAARHSSANCRRDCRIATTRRRASASWSRPASSRRRVRGASRDRPCSGGRPDGRDRRSMEPADASGSECQRCQPCQARRADGTVHRDRALEAQAWSLLRRYGVVFRRLLAREANAAPWRELARVYRRLEARGEIRGGRFVSGMSGEQFALAGSGRAAARGSPHAHDGRWLVISAADPLNLAGIVTTGERVRAVASSRVVYRDGVPVAAARRRLHASAGRSGDHARRCRYAADGTSPSRSGKRIRRRN